VARAVGALLVKVLSKQMSCKYSLEIMDNKSIEEVCVDKNLSTLVVQIFNVELNKD